MYFSNDQIDIQNLNILDLLNKRESAINCCPHCNNKTFIKHGYYKTLQRFRCKNILCFKTFCATTKSPWSYTKKSFDLWKEYLHLIIQNKTLIECSKKLNISITTAFYWRHKILSAMKYIYKPNPIKNFVELKKNSFKENFKGNRKSFSNSAKKTININSSKYERKKIWIISAVDVNDTILSEPISIGYINIHLIQNTIYKKIPKDTYMLTIADTHLRAIELKHNKNLKTSYAKDKKLAILFTRHMPGWFRDFKNVATKYLNSYLTWYIISYQKYYNNFIKFIEALTLSNSFTRISDFKSFKLIICN